MIKFTGAAAAAVVFLVVAILVGCVRSASMVAVGDVIQERKTDIMFPTSLNGCPLKELGYLYAWKYFWPWSVAGVGLYTCETKGTYLATISKDIPVGDWLKGVKREIDKSKYPQLEKERMWSFMGAPKESFKPGDHLELSYLGRDTKKMTLTHNGRLLAFIVDSNMNEFFWMIHLIETREDYQKTWS